MSFIDTRPHQLCGMLAGVPLYHPLADYTSEFTAGPHNLVLGGGSGDHPAAVVNVPAAVASFLSGYALLLDEASEGDVSAIPGTAAHYDVTLELLDELAAELSSPGVPPVDFSDWDANTWVCFTKAARRWSFGHQFRAKDHGPVETWVADSLGEYVVVAFPDLLLSHPDVPPLDRKTFARVTELVAHHPLLGTVATWPTGYLVGGHGDRIGHPNMRH